MDKRTLIGGLLALLVLLLLSPTISDYYNVVSWSHKTHLHRDPTYWVCTVYFQNDSRFKSLHFELADATLNGYPAAIPSEGIDVSHGDSRSIDISFPLEADKNSMPADFSAQVNVIANSGKPIEHGQVAVKERLSPEQLTTSNSNS